MLKHGECDIVVCFFNGWFFTQSSLHRGERICTLIFLLFYGDQFISITTTRSGKTEGKRSKYCSSKMGKALIHLLIHIVLVYEAGLHGHRHKEFIHFFSLLLLTIEIHE